MPKCQLPFAFKLKKDYNFQHQRFTVLFNSAEQGFHKDSLRSLPLTGCA